MLIGMSEYSSRIPSPPFVASRTYRHGIGSHRGGRAYAGDQVGDGQADAEASSGPSIKKGISCARRFNSRIRMSWIGSADFD